MTQLSLFDLGSETPIKKDTEKKGSKKGSTLVKQAPATMYSYERAHISVLDFCLFVFNLCTIPTTYPINQPSTSITKAIDAHEAEPPLPKVQYKQQEASIISHRKRGRKSFKEIDAEIALIDIPIDEILFQKQYYPISQVAKWFRVNNSLLRFWENEFSILKPRKNRKGDRFFRPEDVKNLQLIYYLLRQQKFTIEGAKKYLKTHKTTAEIQLRLATSLQKIKSFLLEIKANIAP